MKKGLAIAVQVYDGPTSDLISRKELEKVADIIEHELMKQDLYFTIDFMQVK